MSIKNNYISTNPNDVEAVKQRELFIAFAIDKIGVPHDHVGASALLTMAVDTWIACKVPPVEVVKMLRQMADMLELDLVHKVEETQCRN